VYNIKELTIMTVYIQNRTDEFRSNDEALSFAPLYKTFLWHGELVPSIIVCGSFFRTYPVFARLNLLLSQ
jgi:hypothetical protein